MVKPESIWEEKSLHDIAKIKVNFLDRVLRLQGLERPLKEISDVVNGRSLIEAYEYLEARSLSRLANKIVSALRTFNHFFKR